MSDYNLTYLEEGKLRWLDAKGRCMIISESGILSMAQGNPAQFNDGSENYVKSCVCDIAPEQDLNGYANPWPAGGGKNLWKWKSKELVNSSGGFTSDEQAARSDYISCSASTAYTVGSCNATSLYAIYVGFYDSSKTFIERGVKTSASSYTLTTPADTAYMIVSFRDDTISEFTETIATSYQCQAESGNALTTYAPYSNICPISGWDSVNVTRTGINIWDEEWVLGDISSSTGVQTTGDKVISKNYCSILPSTTYYNLATTFGNQGVFFYDENKDFIEVKWLYSQTFTTPSNARFFKVRFPSGYGTEYAHNGGINYPSTDTSYHAYNGQTYTTTLPQTVYGGTIDPVSGELTITHKKISLGDYSYGKSAENNFFISSVTDFKYADTSGNTHYGNGLSNAFKFGTNNWSAEDATCTCYYHSGYSGYRIFFRLDSHASDTTTEFKTFMQSIGAEFCYKLATPQTIQLTPTEIMSLYGDNVFSCMDKVTVIYLADTKLYIDNAVNP